MLPEGLVRAARRGRLVMFITEPLGKSLTLPAGVWITTDRSFLPGSGGGSSAAQLEEGQVRCLETGSVLEVAGEAAWGTARRPTRLREWFHEVLRKRTVLFVGSRPDWVNGHFAGGPELAEALAQQVPGTRALAPPPLPAVTSRPGAAAPAALGASVVALWLLLYAAFSGAQNWRWVQLIPWGLTTAVALAALGPLVARAMAGAELPAGEWYARTVARWSRWPRSPILAAVLLVLALWPWWMLRRHALATFVVLYEPGVVSVEGSPPLGACRAEDPCTLIVPRPSHLHFEGAEGGVCGLDFTAPGVILFIDTQQDGCEAFVSDEESAPPRG